MEDEAGVPVENAEVHPVLTDDGSTSNESGESLQNGLGTRRARKRRKRSDSQAKLETQSQRVCRQQVISKLNKFRKDGIMTDVVIAVPDHPDIDAHKIVLAAASPFFQTMFQVKIISFIIL